MIHKCRDLRKIELHLTHLGVFSTDVSFIPPFCCPELCAFNILHYKFACSVQQICSKVTSKNFT